MNKAKFIIIPEIYELEWEINKKTMNKIDMIWKHLSDISFANISKVINGFEMIIKDSKHNHSYLIFLNLIIRKNDKIIDVKDDKGKKIENTILRTAPNEILFELLKNRDLTKSGFSQQN